jgi:hypothetical protein
MLATFEMLRVEHTPPSEIGFDIVWKQKIYYVLYKHIIKSNNSTIFAYESVFLNSNSISPEYISI